MTLRLPFRVLATVVTATAMLTGCLQQQPGDEGEDAFQKQLREIEQFEDLRRELEANRVQVEALGTSAGELTGIGNRLFWLEYPGWAPTLHSYDATTNTRLDYDFSVGPDHNYVNYRASENLVVSVSPNESPLVYRVYSPSASNELVGQFELPSPGGGVRWWAYAPDKSDVYVVVTAEIGVTQLLKWSVGDTEAREVLVFEDLGYDIGEFWDFGVGEGKLIFIEAGRIWSLDLATRELTWLRNETEATSANWDSRGVLFQTAEGPFYYAYANGGDPTDIAAGIEASDYAINETYAASHHYAQDLTRFQMHAGYIGSDGLFTYDMENGTVRPILLNSDREEVTTKYRYPVFLDNGAVFVQGFQGFDAPVFRVDFTF
jgi:hypothetical protein